MNYYLGVELNGNQIKISALRKKKQSYELVKLDSFILPNENDEAVKLITEWINKNLPEPSSVKAILTISESSLYIKEIEFPEMEPDKLNEAVYWEIPTVSPIPQAEAIYDWKIISKEKGLLNVLVIVGKSFFIQNLISTFRKAQVDIMIIEPASYAFARIANAPFDTNTLLCLAEEKGTDFIILKNGIPFFTTSTTGNTQSQKITHIKSAADLTTDIISEGKKIIDYWERKESLNIHQVVVAGDLVYKYIGLNTALNLFPPIPSYIGTYKKIDSIDTGQFKSEELGSFLISLGASARYLQSDIFDGLNLFPAAEKQKTDLARAQKRTISQLSGFLYTNIVIIILLTLGIVALNLWWYSLEKNNQRLNTILTTRTANNLIEQTTKENKTIDAVITLFKRQSNVGEKLKTISDLTPQTIKLISVSLVNSKTKEWKIEGTGDRDSILAFHKNLETNVKAKEITIAYDSFEKETDNLFTISMTW